MYILAPFRAINFVNLTFKFVQLKVYQHIKPINNYTENETPWKVRKTKNKKVLCLGSSNLKINFQSPMIIF